MDKKTALGWLAASPLIVGVVIMLGMITYLAYSGIGIWGVLIVVWVLASACAGAIWEGLSNE